MSDNPVPFALTNGEKLSPVWVRLKAHFEEELARARARNDDIKLGEVGTALVRGEIKRLKALIALGDEDRPQTE